MRHPQRGFSLVELLVVITIIGLFLALLFPAVQMAREMGHQTTCTNNQHEISTAILAFEASKGHLPGVLSPIAGTSPLAYCNWVEAILPNMDRNDLWEAVRTNNIAKFLNSKLPSFICPDDPLISPQTPSVMSYGVNDYYFLSYAAGGPPRDRNNVIALPPILSKLSTREASPKPVALSTTIMLGDRTKLDTNTLGSSRAGKWTDVDPKNYWPLLSFHWPLPSDAPVTISPKIMVASHSGIVVVTFLDGHTDKVKDDTIYPGQ